MKRKQPTKAKAEKASEKAKDKPSRIGPDLKALHVCLMRAVSANALIDGAKDAKQGKNSISQHLLAAARTFPTLQTFKDECTMQEKWLKSDEGLAKVQETYPELNYNGRKIPACWVQAKSNIVKAWTHEKDIAGIVDGFTLKACTTESNMRAALNTWRKGKDARESLQAIDRLSNVVRSLERAKGEGLKGASAAVDQATKDINAMLAVYKEVLAKVLPVKPKKGEAKKAA